jgi:glutathione S-transferase
MTELKLSVMKASVNNMSVRVFVRAAGIDFIETDVYGSTRSAEFMARNPAHLTPMIEVEGLPRKALWESCAIMQYLCNEHHLEQFYPTDPKARAMIDSAMFYLIGTLYPLVSRATYGRLKFEQYPGEVGWSDADQTTKDKASRHATEALAAPLEVFHDFYLNGQPFIGGSKPSIADIRLAATLEFVDIIDYELPAWAADYKRRVEDALGDAYKEPAADVRGYIAYARSL